MDNNETLIGCLRNFEGPTDNNEKALDKPFSLIAKKLLLGGYFQIKDKKGNLLRTIKLQTVEFYYHCELEKGIKDYIVYHRNPDDKSIEPKELPALPLGSLHTHQSGIDITFEDPNNKSPLYRASALIRACQVIEHTGNLSNFFFNAYPLVENRSTYVYNAFFMGANVLGEDNGIEIQWVDDDTCEDNCNIANHHRQNVGLYKPDPRLIKNDYYHRDYNEPFEQDERPWAFTRSPYHISRNIYTCPLCGGKVSSLTPNTKKCGKCGVEFIINKK